MRTERTEVEDTGFPLTQRALRVVAVSPAEQTKQLKVISLCSHTHHQPLTKLLFAKTWLGCRSRCCQRDNKGTRCGSDEIWQRPGGGAPGEGKSLPALRERGAGRVSPPPSQRASRPLLPKSDHLPPPARPPISFLLPLPLTSYKAEALCLTLLCPLAATLPLSLVFTSRSRQQHLHPGSPGLCSTQPGNLSLTSRGI